MRRPWLMVALVFTAVILLALACSTPPPEVRQSRGIMQPRDLTTTPQPSTLHIWEYDDIDAASVTTCAEALALEIPEAGPVADEYESRNPPYFNAVSAVDWLFCNTGTAPITVTLNFGGSASGDGGGDADGNGNARVAERTFNRGEVDPGQAADFGEDYFSTGGQACTWGSYEEFSSNHHSGTLDATRTYTFMPQRVVDGVEYNFYEVWIWAGANTTCGVYNEGGTADAHTYMSLVDVGLSDYTPTPTSAPTDTPTPTSTPGVPTVCVTATPAATPTAGASGLYVWSLPALQAAGWPDCNAAIATAIPTTGPTGVEILRTVTVDPIVHISDIKWRLCNKYNAPITITLAYGGAATGSAAYPGSEVYIDGGPYNADAGTGPAVFNEAPAGTVGAQCAAPDVHASTNSYDSGNTLVLLPQRIDENDDEWNTYYVTVGAAGREGCPGGWSASTYLNITDTEVGPTFTPTATGTPAIICMDATPTATVTPSPTPTATRTATPTATATARPG